MGVPKFFRYISERYPCLSEVVKDYQIPEFDNMYLDMNGIIHMCSHPDDNNPHFRITEEKIFKDIFHYLEVLFRMIRPQKLFFMAIDGVAPRAKMNQQRGRRFRSAKDAEKQEADALKKGEILPSESRFDSNCITPGTVFMARLHEQLKYFVVDKLSNDSLWRGVTVILSGHETPGEGEHKIMDYIRYMRSQPGYDPNTRHCLYGLDADLIMLGLCTHEPHFSLLREEVKFGKKSKRLSVPEEITFFLLHLSLMREYLELEFAPVKEKLTNFEYDFEKIIDDWVLMGFLVGNDFIPNLPHLHIADGALPILYKAYMDVLPTLDGYINEAGTLNLSRFEKFMQKLSDFDIENFEDIRDDKMFLESKKLMTAEDFLQPLIVDPKVFKELSNMFAYKPKGKSSQKDTQQNNGDRDIPGELLKSEKSKSNTDSQLAALIKDTDDMFSEESENDSDKDEDELAFENFKKDYYRNKLDYENVTPEVLRDQAEGYVRAIQWNLNYYYNGVCSWSWYYPHHYAPYISDIKDFSNLKIDFELGQPFKPYEQLLAVLPPASKDLLPSAYHALMTSEESVMKEYYPDNFETDLNGKKQEWEAVVLIPFMDEKLLLESMQSCNDKLTPEELRRNQPGPMLVYTFTSQDMGQYDAPGYFPPVKRNRAKLMPLTIESIRVPRDKLVKGAYPGASFDVYYPGFPTMKHLKYTAQLEKAKVRVFEQPSRYENMILKIIQEEEIDGENDVPVHMLNTNVFVGWPHLIEARVVAISNAKRKYISMGGQNQYNTEEYDKKNYFETLYGGIVDRYKNNLGVEVGDVQIVCHVQVMIGRKYVFSPSGRLTLEKQFSENTAVYPLQTVVSEISVFDQHHSTFRDVLDVFSEGSICFTLCNPYYGSQGIVLDSREIIARGRIKVCISVTEEPDFEHIRRKYAESARAYKPLHVVSSQLGMSHILFSRTTGSIFVSVKGSSKDVNIGLDLKLNKRNKETPGYTKRVGATWYYSDKCLDLVRQYTEKFPEVFCFFCQNVNKHEIAAKDIFSEDICLPTFNSEKQTCGSNYIEQDIVQKIESTVDEFLKIAQSKKITMQVKPSLLYKPEIQSKTLAPDDKMTVEILDRIINTRKGFSVPFGLKGTVIAKTESLTNNDMDVLYDVVFDKTFKDGMTLNCSAERGYRLPKTAFINISYGRRLLEEKTGKQGSLVALAESGQKQSIVLLNNNSQRFFNQFSQNNQLGLNQNKSYLPNYSQAEHNLQGSAFASFNNQANEPPYQKNQQQQILPYNSSTQVESSFQPRQIKVGKKTDEEKPTTSKKVLTKTENPSLPSMPPRTVNTEYLKNLLKIGMSENKELNAPKNKIKQVEPVQDSTPKSTSSNNNSNNSGNLSFEMLAAKVAEAPSSVRLLTYYQSNNLGIPRYQYFQSDGQYRAQITLSNGEIVMGKPGQNKELATENVASDVLHILIQRAKGTDASHGPDKNLPVPPKTWVKPQQESTASETKSSRRRNDQALKTALHNPFVPTQVIKRQSNKSISETTQGDNSVCVSASSKTQKHLKNTDKPAKNNEKENGNHQNNHHKAKKNRLPRIAANFSQCK
ncbi:LOW QUALITY PROTEIN: 5'-3' exoribonuclease 1-like [Sitophilus oryzae]|uniref:5'-3' exoribonuclease 1 n=1 Tax=Sitophilus oryzae TaxID=7048 RepID=A0A6J2YJG6_SITOR|nr:LOW QUALITY PROTEIN: 5'-3' exoribonuclease 1-like [Sitophilus oryzae]